MIRVSAHYCRTLCLPFLSQLLERYSSFSCLLLWMLHGMNNSVIVNALLSDICISEIGSCWKQGSVMVISDRYYLISKINHKFVHAKVRMAEWSKAPDSSSGPLTRAWVQIPLLTFFFLFVSWKLLLLWSLD